MEGGISENIFDIFDILIYLLTAIGQPPGGSSTVHIYTHTETVHKWTGLDRCGNSRPIGFRSRTVQPVAQSLYRLSYPAHIKLCTFAQMFNERFCLITGLGCREVFMKLTLTQVPLVSMRRSRCQRRGNLLQQK